MRGVATLALGLVSTSLVAAEPVRSTPAVYEELRAARPAAATLAVSNLALVRDAIRLDLESGTIQLLPPVSGRTVGALFVGKGTWTVTPATEGEKRRLAYAAWEKTPTVEALSDRFDRLLLLFTDTTADEISKAGAAGPPGDASRAASQWEKLLKRERKLLDVNLQVRVLADLLENVPTERGVFLGIADGGKRPTMLLVHDPRGVSAVGFGAHLGGEKTGLFAIHREDGGFWYLSRTRAEAQAGAEPAALPDVDVLHCEIDTTIRKNTDLEGTARVTARVLRNGLVVLPFALFSKLRLASATLEGAGGAETPLSFVQEEPEVDAGASVVLPAPQKAGEEIRIRFAYRGEDVLSNEGDGNFAVGARQSWYPNLGGFTDPATFDLTYRVPKKYEVVSVGAAVSQAVEGAQSVSRWKSERPLRAAGFNYGVFRKLEKADPDTGMTIRVFTNPGKPDAARILEELDLTAANFDTTRLADAAMADGINASRTGTVYFGALPEKTVSITQQSEWSFGQSWPSLVFLPYLAFLPSTTRVQLGLMGSGAFVDQVGWHEMAHQWWGHHVGWATYRDQWLSEGFAEFSAALVANQTGGRAAYRAFWAKARKALLEKGIGSGASIDAGPLTDGFRLATRKAPGAYGDVVYLKGAYVVHMLRMSLFDWSAKDPDARFRALMTDFTTTWAGRNPSTADFRRVAEKHMTPNLDLTGDRSLAWFFSQWVDGVEVPKLAAKLDATPAADGKWRIQGSVTQSGVSEGFRTPVPLYLEFENGALVRFAQLLAVGSTTVPVDATIALPAKPKRVLANAMHDVLARD